MLFKSEITIASSPEKVWDTFVQCDQWILWWGGELKSAEWVQGGKMYWGIGGYSTILEIKPAKKIHYQLKGSYIKDTIYTFQPGLLGQSTRVTVEADYQGVTGGASKQNELEDELARLKKLVEKGSV
jgi:hypothetical protein